MVVKINNKSDFKINEWSESIALEVPFEFIYYIPLNKEKYVASYDGHSYINCVRLADGSLDVIFNNHGLGIGRLKVVRKYFVDDLSFADGVFDVISDDQTDVFLTSGKTFDTYVKTLVVPPYLKGDKGDPMTWETMTEKERGELVKDIAEAIDPEMVMTENEKLRQEAEQGRQTAEQQRSTTFNTLKGEMQSAITAGNAAAGNAQKVVDEYDEKVSEQDSKLSELGTEATTEHKGLMSAEDKSRLAISNSYFIKEANTLQDAINTLVNIIPYDDKRSGVMVTYTDSNNVVHTYTFMSDTGFTNPTRWRSNVVNPYIESEQPVGYAYRLSDIIDYIKVAATGDIDTDAAYSFGYFGYFSYGKFALQVKKNSEVLGEIELDTATLTGTLVTSNFIIEVKVSTLYYRHDIHGVEGGAYDYSQYYNRIAPQLFINAKLDWETKTLATDIEVLESKNTSNTNKVRHIEGAVFEVSKELVDVTYNGGYYTTAKGTYVEDAARSCTNKMNVAHGEKYFVTVNIGGSGVIAYLSQWNNDAWVGIADGFKANSGNAVEREYVVPEGVTHIAVCSYNTTPPTLTKSVVSDSTTFYTKDETYNRSEVDMLIASSSSGGSEADSNFINNVETVTFKVEDNVATEATKGTGWSGDLVNGYMHTSGNTEPLEFSLPYAVGDKFILDFNCDGVKGDSTDLLIAVGDTPTVKSYNGMNTFRLGFIANGGKLKITPQTNFSSTITDVTIRRISENGSTAVTINVGDVYSQANSMITAFWNVAIGSLYETMSNLVNGSRNIAIGKRALNTTPSGNRNIAIGTFAMPFLTDAENNVAIGADTIYPLKQATGCVGIGKATLGGSQRADDCVAIGRQAMGIYTLAKDRKKCTAVGVESGYGITDSCTHVGYRAGANVSGAKNTSIGYGSMAVGERSTIDIVGEELTCVGYYSQVDNTTEAKAAKNSTAIGANTKITKSNQVVIGNANVEEVVIAGKKIIFNADGSVRWESI